MTTLLLWLATLGVTSSLVYYAVSLIIATRFAAHADEPAPPLPKPPPRIAVLKPLSGLSSSLLANLTSYLESGYPRADFFFAVPSYEDRAAEAPVALRSQYPYASITLVVGDEAGVVNRKIAKVIRMAERAERADAFVLSDADISVERGHLERLIGELFADERVGMVTCAYRARPSGTFASRLAALFINTDFTPQVMLAAKDRAFALCLRRDHRGPPRGSGSRRRHAPARRQARRRLRTGPRGGRRRMGDQALAIARHLGLRGAHLRRNSGNASSAGREPIASCAHLACLPSLSTDLCGRS